MAALDAHGKALIVATVPDFFRHMGCVHDVLAGEGLAVEAAANFSLPQSARIPRFACLHDVGFARSPLRPDNLRAYRKVRRLLKSCHYDLVFCNTPVGGVVGRIAARATRRQGTKVVYMAHGFHFFKGAPPLNWLVFFPMEWACSWLTDVLVTITEEDYALACRHLHARRVCHVPGVGVDISRFGRAKPAEGLREGLGIGADDVMLLTVGELNRNKNHQVVIRALAMLDPSVHYVVVGSGDQATRLLEMARDMGVQGRLHLLGTRGDVADIMAAADIYVLPSLREGLNVSLIEAMASGLPCVCRRMRGNVDLVTDQRGGILVDGDEPGAWAEAIRAGLACDRDATARHNKAAAEAFSCERVTQCLREGLGLA